MGWLTAAGSAGRVLFPALNTVLPDDAMLAASAAVSLACGIAVAIYFLRLNAAGT
jgi:hypothetical protein